jgi:general secretion pathway protein L
MASRRVEWTNTARTAAAAAFRWWTGQLVSLVPQSLRLRLQPRRAMIVIDDREGQIAIGRIANGQYREVARAPVPGDAGDQTPLKVSGLQTADDAAIRLPREKTLTKRFALPATTLPNLRQIITYDMDRLVPFSVDDVYFDYRAVDAKGSAWIDVELAVVPRSTVDQSVALASRLGLTPSIVGQATSNDGELPQFNFLPSGQRAARTKRLKAIELLLVAGLVLSIAALAFAAAHRQQATIDDFTEKLAAARGEAAVADKTRKGVKQLSEQIRFFDEKRRRAATIQVLLELTRLLPDDAWVFNTQLNGDDVRVSGFSPRASGLIGLIEQSSRFGAAQFSAPLVQASQSGLERFDLSFKIRGGEGP